FARRLASYGIITLLRDDPGVLTVTTEVEADLTYLVSTWLLVQNSDASSPLFGRVDLAHVGLAGHSRGGKASLLATEHGLAGKVAAWFGLDPVDASAFSGGEQARDDLGGLRIPTAYLGASVSSTCAPVADNYAVLYAATPSPSVQLVG